jgi:hypothetical protein
VTPRSDTEPDNEDALALEETMLAFLVEELVLHHLPILILGSGRSSLLAHKFYVVMFGFFLVSASAISAFVAFARSFLSNTADFGVEFGLSSVQPVPFRTLFPWYVGTEHVFGAAQWGGDADADFDGIPPDPELENPAVGLNESLGLPGLLHVLHNAGNSTMAAVPVLEEAVGQMAEICNVCSHARTRGRLLATCFDDPVGRCFHSTMRKFAAHVCKARWGTFAFATEQVLERKQALIRFWDEDTYLQGSSGYAQMGGANALGGPRVDIAGDAIQSNFFWAVITTGDLLFDMLRQCFRWAEGARAMVI